jgi:anti-sigma factor RsiW
MQNENFHPSDEDLVLCADGELSRRRTVQIREHLAACWDCRARMAEFERTIGDFVKVHHCRDAKLPPIARARTRLEQQLAAHGDSRRERWWRLQFANGRGFAYGCALALLVLTGLAVIHFRTTERDSLASADAMLLPDRTLTPGATRAVSIGEICSMDHDQVVRPVSEVLQEKVFQEYGLRNVRAENYEVDYLISPGLGGADDIRNLWPEPRYNTTWNSFVKDQLEDYLHESVCRGKISLANAQKEVANDWISAYKKYFHTEEPVGVSSRFNGVKELAADRVRKALI